MQVDLIIMVICQEHNIKKEQFFSRSRKTNLVKARQRFSYIARKLLGTEEIPFSLHKIGNILNQDHSTIIHSINVVKNDIEIYNENTIIEKIIEKIYQKNIQHQMKKESKCFYCERGTVIHFVKTMFNYALISTIDHVIPTSKGGLNINSNKVSSCQECNGWKGNKDLEEWRLEVEDMLQKNKTIKFKTYDRIDLQNIIKNIKNIKINE